MSVLFLMTCHLPSRTTREYVPPQLISDSFISFYPPEAYEKQLEGKVILLICVGTNGYIDVAGIFRSSGYDILDEAALAIARTVRFKPGRVDGRVQDLWVTWPVVFELSSVPMSTLGLVEWQRRVLKYQANASDVNSLKGRIAQNNLFNHYVNLGNRMIENRSIFPNKTIMEVVASPIRDSWIEYQDVWPMAFVLFQDYIERFPDSRNVAKAERHLVDSALNEVSLLRVASTGGSQLVRARQRLLNDLTRFLEEYYLEASRQNPT